MYNITQTTEQHAAYVCYEYLPIGGRVSEVAPVYVSHVTVPAAIINPPVTRVTDAVYLTSEASAAE